VAASAARRDGRGSSTRAPQDSWCQLASPMSIEPPWSPTWPKQATDRSARFCRTGVSGRPAQTSCHGAFR
jgi:hypothetical protein